MSDTWSPTPQSEAKKLAPGEQGWTLAGAGDFTTPLPRTLSAARGREDAPIRSIETQGSSSTTTPSRVTIDGSLETYGSPSSKEKPYSRSIFEVS